MFMKKRGVSPVIATILLIGIVIVIALIVFLWLRGMQQEAITKFEGMNVRLVCEEVSFDASYSAGYVYVVNNGNVPIYRLKAKVSGDGSQDTFYLGENKEEWNKVGLLIGDRYSEQISTSGKKILLVPILVGTSEKGKKAYTCDDRVGKEILIN